MLTSGEKTLIAAERFLSFCKESFSPNRGVLAFSIRQKKLSYARDFLPLLRPLSQGTGNEGR